MGYTVTEIAEAWGVDKELARGLVKFLVHVGYASDRGKRAPEGGHGRAETIYAFLTGYGEALRAFLAAHPLPP